MHTILGPICLLSPVRSLIDLRFDTDVTAGPHTRPMCRHVCLHTLQMGVRVMDNNDQERERGITILAKVGSLC